MNEEATPVLGASSNRRRVSLINYKGGSGRILGAKLNKNNGNHHQKNIFQRKSQMSEKSTNGCREKYKKQNDKNQKKMFLIKISSKMNFGDRNCHFQSLRGHENTKNSCQQ